MANGGGEIKTHWKKGYAGTGTGTGTDMDMLACVGTPPRLKRKVGCVAGSGSDAAEEGVGDEADDQGEQVGEATQPPPKKHRMEDGAALVPATAPVLGQNISTGGWDENIITADLMDAAVAAAIAAAVDGTGVGATGGGGGGAAVNRPRVVVIPPKFIMGVAVDSSGAAIATAAAGGGGAAAAGAGAGAAEPPLKKNWASAIDQASRKEYFYHAVTKEVTWVRPSLVPCAKEGCTTGPLEEYAHCKTHLTPTESTRYRKANFADGRGAKVKAEEKEAAAALTSFKGKKGGRKKGGRKQR